MSFIHLPLSDSVLEIGICEGGEESVSMTFCFLRVFLGFFYLMMKLLGVVFLTASTFLNHVIYR